MSILRAVSFVLLLAGLAPAQPLCIGDDGFDVTCCAPPTPNLPPFAPLNMSADYAALGVCSAVGFSTTGAAQFGAPSFFLADYATIGFSATLPGAGQVNGVLLAKYARTWMDLSSSGVAVQVWRFLINGDLSWTSLGAAGSFPPIAGAPWFGPVHMTGHVDYACDPTLPPSTVQAAFSLTVAPGCIGHAAWSGAYVPALSTQGASYHIVGPAPFTFGGASEPQGNIVGDASRTATFFWLPFTYQAEGEAKIGASGSLTTSFADCLCSGPPTAPSPWKHQVLQTTTCCPFFSWTPVIQSIPILGTVIPTGFASLPIGQWNAPAGQFPETRSLSYHVGLVTHQYTCGPVLIPLHAVTGVSTSNHLGQTFLSSTAPCSNPAALVSSHWMDLQNMWLISQFPNKFPSLGSLFASDLVISLNM